MILFCVSEIRKEKACNFYFTILSQDGSQFIETRYDGEKRKDHSGGCTGAQFVNGGSSEFCEEELTQTFRIAQKHQNSQR